MFSSPDFEPQDERPADFPYWEHVTQRRYEGPSVIYLGAGWVLTARHVGIGEVLLEGESFTPNMLSRHTLLNANGTAADAIVFQLNFDTDTDLPDLPILPLATVAPLPGEEVMLIGFGRERAKVIEWNQEGQHRFGFEWSKRGSKRWGTNRINADHAILVQQNLSTHSVTFVFDSPSSENTTQHEAQAALGDSGGAVFVKRDDDWLLVGMMTSVSAHPATPGHTTVYGDTTFAADISVYRNEILRWARPRCSNDEDDDGDGKIDFPLDPGCSAPGDLDERDESLITRGNGMVGGLALVGSCVLGVVMWAFVRARKQA